MKLLLKLILAFGIFVVCVYAISPWWIPHMVASQLPPPFQLHSLQVSYPGLSGIHLKSLDVKGDFPALGLALKATDIRIKYRDWQTEIDSVLLDVRIQPAQQEPAGNLSVEDLSFPMTRFTGSPPRLNVGEIQLVLHHELNFKPSNIVAGEPLVLLFQAVNLRPHADNGFHLDSTVSTEQNPQVTGLIDIDLTQTSRKADIRFPVTPALSPWLSVSIEQTDRGSNTTTQVQTMLDTGVQDQTWLRPIVEWGSAGRFSNMDGKLELLAQFAGEQRQNIEYLSMTATDLRASSGQESLVLNTQFLVHHEDGNIIVSLPAPAEVRYQDRTGRINAVLQNLAPGLTRRATQDSRAHAEIAQNSRLVFQQDTDHLADFRGGFDIDINSPASKLNLHAVDMHITTRDFSSLDLAAANGVIMLDWRESEPIAYRSDELDLTIDKTTIQTELTLDEGNLVSKGSGTLVGGQLISMATSAKRVEVSWNQLDLFTWVGDLQARTSGFATEIEGETWSGFDFDIELALLSHSDVEGSATVHFDNGISFPFDFEGNTKTERSDVTLPTTSLNVSQLDGLLRYAHIELPEPIKLTGGHIDVSGIVKADDELTAQMTIEGFEVSAAMLKSRARNARFSLNSSYEKSISATGPVTFDTIKLAGGIDLKQIRVDLEVRNTGDVKLRNLYAELFDGQLHLDSLQYSNDRIEDTSVELTHINLEHLLAFANIDGLEGTGFLAFSLPAGSDDTGMHISHGTYRSEGPGRLAYKKGGVVNNNIGLQALENFQYKDLSGTIDYQSNGTYRIGVRLEGKNPDLYGGHPVILNLNINGSLPALFEALFISGNFEESILKQIGIDKR